MTVLFICKWNQGRSQIAAALFNKYTSQQKGMSAGTNANKQPAIPLAECSPLTVKVLKEVNINTEDKTPTQLDQQLTEQADKIVVMADTKDLPEYVLHSDKTIYWDVDDPDGKD